MRVTHIITRLIVGGAQENTIASVLGLRHKPGLEVDLISGPSEGPEGSLEFQFKSSAPNQNASVPNETVNEFPLSLSERERAGVRVPTQDKPPTLTIVPSLTRPIHPIKDFFALRQLTKYFRRTRPDIVHTHSGKAGILGRLAAARAGVPIIIHHIHGPSFGPFQGPVANAVFLTAEKIAARTTTHFLCSANAMTRRYLAAGIGRPEMYTRILSGFRIEPFVEARNDLKVRAELGLPEDAFVIGKIGRLAQLKGHEDLFKAFAI